MGKNVLYVAGILFVAIGAIGFTSHHVFRLFDVNTLQSLVYLVSGVLSLGFSRKPDAAAKKFAVVLGIVYALATTLGFLLGGNIFSLVYVNLAANIMHLVLAVILLAAGLDRGPGIFRVISEV